MNLETNSLILPPISPAAPGPLYQQIAEGIKREISEGRLKPGQPLPSFRNLAEDLMVSLITVKRAYEELERDGIVFRKQGLGTFVSDEGVDRNREAKRKQAEALMREAIEKALDAGLTESDIAEMVEHTIRSLKGGKRK